MLYYLVASGLSDQQTPLTGHTGSSHAAHHVRPRRHRRHLDHRQRPVEPAHQRHHPHRGGVRDRGLPELEGGHRQDRVVQRPGEWADQARCPGRVRRRRSAGHDPLLPWVGSVRAAHHGAHPPERIERRPIAQWHRLGH